MTKSICLLLLFISNLSFARDCRRDGGWGPETPLDLWFGKNVCEYKNVIHLRASLNRSFSVIGQSYDRKTGETSNFYKITSDCGFFFRDGKVAAVPSQQKLSIVHVGWGDAKKAEFNLIFSSAGPVDSLQCLRHKNFFQGDYSIAEINKKVGRFFDISELDPRIIQLFEHHPIYRRESTASRNRRTGF